MQLPMTMNNPILTGMHPDPSISRVGEDYYLVNSTFEYFPGIPVYHSKDLINWELVSHCITRNTQLTLRAGFPGETGIYAPTIRYHEGTYYVICTNVSYGGEDDGNFVVTTKDPHGEWSDPIWIALPGIDPSLYWEDDGRLYYTGTANAAIYLCELDSVTWEPTSKPMTIWEGTGGNDPEGPHLYRIGDWYYLLISEGGTEYGHMITMARSAKIEGPYESCPFNPVLTNRSTSLPIKAVGHADLFQDHAGKWWAVCLGIRPITYPFKHSLGRETMLVAAEWDEQGWIHFGEDGHLPESIDLGRLPLLGEPSLPDPARGYGGLYHIYNPIPGLVEDKEEGLLLWGNEVAMGEAGPMAILCRRQQNISFVSTLTFTFVPEQEGEEAGFSVYLNHRHHYDLALRRVQGKMQGIFRRQIGSLCMEEEVSISCDASLDYAFVLQGDQQHFSFGYYDGIETIMVGKMEAAYLTTEVGGKFTGNMIAVYATGNGQACISPLHVKRLDYVGQVS